jgi:cell division protein FtsB
MTQRRTPSGQGPARRPQAGRAAGGRAAAPRAGGGRSSGAASAGARGAETRAGRTAGREQAGVRGELRRSAQAARAADGSRSANRPAAARRGGSGGSAAGVKRTTAPQPRRLTGRATILLVILTALALGYTYPVRVYLDQESEITRIRAAQEAQRTRIEGLREEVAKWQDDEYVRIQAKKRFYFVRPGEIPLVVWDSETTPGDPGGPATAAEPPPPPWYDTLWSSIRAADRERGP